MAKVTSKKATVTRGRGCTTIEFPKVTVGHLEAVQRDGFWCIESTRRLGKALWCTDTRAEAVAWMKANQ